MCIYGGDLGKQYSANHVHERCVYEQTPQLRYAIKQRPELAAVLAQNKKGMGIPSVKGIKAVAEERIQQEQEGSLADELREDQRRRKKKASSIRKNKGGDYHN